MKEPVVIVLPDGLLHHILIVYVAVDLWLT